MSDIKIKDTKVIEKVKKSYYVTDALHDALKEQSDKENIGLNELVKEILSDYMHYVAPVINKGAIDKRVLLGRIYSNMDYFTNDDNFDSACHIKNK